MDLLNSDVLGERLKALEEIIKKTSRPPLSGDTNNHIHTFYSFSPYSPSKAIYMAYTSGLEVAGIIDHDSVAGCREFIEAGRIAGIDVTIGAECRVSFKGTRLFGRRINNPDQRSIAYVVLHALPHESIDAAADFFRPYVLARNERNRAMTKKLSEICGIPLDFDKDVLPLSKFHEGGSMTERHILFALSKKLVTEGNVFEFFGRMGITPSKKAEGLLKDTSNPYLEYDLLGVLKSALVEKFYIDADEECPHVSEFIKFSKKAGAIAAYAYLGDVTDSVTGDKAAAAFEDSYLEMLFEEITNAGFDAVTYMPARNTMEQLLRVRELCKKHNLLEISGEDINSPRQGFICEKLKDPIFSNLVDSAHYLVKHERGLV